MAEQFKPRTPHAIMRDLLAKVVGRTKLNDVTVGSALYTLLQSMAYEVANIEGRIAGVRNSFDLNTATGSDLDVRVSELPPVGITRRTQSIATGSVLKLTRGDGGSGQLIVPKGARVGRSEDNFQYFLPEDVTIPDGTVVSANILVVADQGGTKGNCTSGKINIIVDMPSGISGVENVGAITNGLDRESDDSLRNRAMRYIRSLGRCQIDALVSLGLNFIGSNGETFRFANVFEDPVNLGYSELIVDDGSGLKSFNKPGELTTATVPTGGQDFIYHQYPAVEPITASQINIIKSAGVVSPQEHQIKSIPERGIIHILDDTLLVAGDVWQVNGYDVFRGPIEELQKEIEGSSDADGNTSTGFRAAGTRVRVLPPIVKEIFMSVSIDVKPEFDIKEVKRSIKEQIETYFSSLGIGEPLYIADLTKDVMLQSKVYSVKFFEYGTSTLLENIYPGNQKTVLRSSAANILYT